MIGVQNVYSKHPSPKCPLWQVARQRKKFAGFVLLCVFLQLPYLTGCGVFPKADAEAQPSSRRSPGGGRTTSVEVAIAETGILQEPLEYTGSTQPVREVSLRAQVEGRLLNLQADVGDRVKQGQILARLDDSLLVTSVTQAQAELAALQSEVTRAQSQVRDAQAVAEQARAELRQAQADAARLRSLYSSGAIAQQQAEIAQTEAATAQQKLSSAIAKIATEQQAVAAAQGRVAAQRAAIAQTQERQSYALLASPITGVVVAKVSEPGNLIQPGGEVLRLADFSSVKVVVPVSELELSKIRVGQSVQVRLDAFAKKEITGKVTRISPAADATARQLPIEITIPNSNNQIGSGLLARVSFAPQTTPRVTIPETALVGSDQNKSTGASTQGRNSTSPLPSAREGSQNQKSSEGTVFVLTGKGAQATVQSRRVQLGTRANGQVEILSGLQAGEQFVARTAKPLKDGETVRLSVLSQTPKKQEQR
ncbi:MAG TPA: efflux transporter periplasmic adaptor subunit [Cyanobacteria bacterium UBA8553]|nr:efflux transporter periplasmic adaptor subunit [Cyanobacteria bacterium UBA8553]HAJ58007.1 efflux transporter periplasmic adaptor subunit [Cyanobacteria bacterium UBA8543]